MIHRNFATTVCRLSFRDSSLSIMISSQIILHILCIQSLRRTTLLRRLLLEIKVTNDSSRNHFQNRCTKRQAINSRVMPYSDSYRIHEIHRYNNLYITEVVCALMVYYCNEHYGIRYAALSLEKYYFLLELIRQIDAL